MNLEQASAVAQIVSSVLTAVLTGVGAYAAWFAYRWNRQNAKIEAQRRLSEDLRHYNELVLSDPTLQKYEAEHHPWGTITQNEVIQMYRYFILLNIYVNLWEAWLRGSVDEAIFTTAFNHFANTSYDDQAFIKKHVLPRGYPKKFRELLVQGWSLVSERGVLAPV